MRISCLTRWTLAASALLLAACESGEGKTAYIGGAVFDGTGAPLLLDATIIVANGRIETIGRMSEVSVPGGAREIRVDGKYVIPGLIDAHAHPERWTLDAFLAYGVTAVRDAGGNADSLFALRDEVALGSIRGPRLFVAGAMIDAAPPTREGATGITTPVEARGAVDRLVAADASHAKVYTRLDETLLEAVMVEAEMLELPVAAHLGVVDAVTAARLGVRSLEHMSGIVEATTSNPAPLRRAHSQFLTGWNMAERLWSGLDSAALDRTVAALIEAGTAIVPTLVLHETWAHLTDQAYAARLDLSAVPAEIRAAWDVPDLVRRAGLTTSDFRAFQLSRPMQDRLVRMFRRAGGLVAAGTDAPNQLLAPGASMHDELALLVDAGLIPRQALLAATRDAAALLGAPDALGVLQPGMLADFVVLNANPLDDIANTRDIEFVVTRGVIYRPDELVGGS
jgi:imidazolonepropionase-like amidohydrolase